MNEAFFYDYEEQVQATGRHTGIHNSTCNNYLWSIDTDSVSGLEPNVNIEHLSIAVILSVAHYTEKHVCESEEQDNCSTFRHPQGNRCWILHLNKFEFSRPTKFSNLSGVFICIIICNAS